MEKSLNVLASCHEHEWKFILFSVIIDKQTPGSDRAKNLGLVFSNFLLR